VDLDDRDVAEVADVGDQHLGCHGRGLPLRTCWCSDDGMGVRSEDLVEPGLRPPGSTGPQARTGSSLSGSIS
jgi:hypothetical protein